MGYIIAKAVENARSCDDSPENEPLKSSDEIDTNTEITDKSETSPEDVAARKSFSDPNNNNDGDIEDTDDNNEEANEFGSNPNMAPQKLPLLAYDTEIPVHTEKEDNVTNEFSTQDVPLEENVYYRAINSKDLIISGLYLPIGNENGTNVSKTEELVADLEELVTISPEGVNETKVMDVLNGDEANGKNGNEMQSNNKFTDVNIRELREHLLDHLLEYFINIIKEENVLQNSTRKNNGKDSMKVEDKLRHYYHPHHSDMVLDDDDDYDDNTNSYDSEEDLGDNEELIMENNSSNYPVETLEEEINEYLDEPHKSPEDSEELMLNLDENLNINYPEEEAFNVNLSEPVTTEYINLIEKEHDFSIDLSSTTEKSEDDFDGNINVITTTERSFWNDDLHDETAEIDKLPFDYSDELTNGQENVYDNGAVTEDYTNYEDFSYSDEFEVTKNVTDHEKDIEPIVHTEENRRRQNMVYKENVIADDTSSEFKNDTVPRKLATHDTSNTYSKHDKKGVTNELPVINKLSINIEESLPCDDNEMSSKKSDHASNNKHRHRKHYDGLINKNKCNRKCRNGIVLNVNININ